MAAEPRMSRRLLSSRQIVSEVQGFFIRARRIERTPVRMNVLPQTPGRVNLNAQNLKEVERLPGFQYEKSGSSTATTDGIRGNWEENILNQTFFSTANFKIMQNKIRYEVYTETKQVIDEQSSDDLFMVMRAIYLSYGRNLPTNIRGQIEELNNYVSDWCVPRIIAEMEMYQRYLKDISAMPVPMAHPMSLSSAGTKSLPFKPFFEPENANN